MFLHDELYKMCQERKITTPADAALLYNDIMNRCYTEIQSKIHVGMPNKKAKAVIDRTFNFYKCFVRKMIKSNDKSLVGIGKFFEKHNFKDSFFLNDAFGDVYNGL